MNGESCWTGNDREGSNPKKISIGLVSFLAGIRPGTFGIYPDGGRDFCVPQTVHTSSGVHPASLMYRGSCPGVQQPGCEVDHSRSSSAEIKNKWSYTYTPSIGLFSIPWTRTLLFFKFTFRIQVIRYRLGQSARLVCSVKFTSSQQFLYNMSECYPSLRYGRSLCDFLSNTAHAFRNSSQQSTCKTNNPSG